MIVRTQQTGMQWHASSLLRQSPKLLQKLGLRVRESFEEAFSIFPLHVLDLFADKRAAIASRRELDEKAIDLDVLER